MPHLASRRGTLAFLRVTVVLSVLALALAIVGRADSAATGTLVPVKNGGLAGIGWHNDSLTQCSPNGTNCFDRVEDPSLPPTFTTYIRKASEIGIDITFDLDLSGVPDGSLITAVAISFRCSGFAEPAFRSLVRVDGVTTEYTGAPADCVTTDHQTQTHLGFSITKGAATDLEIGARSTSTDELRIFALGAVITYSPPAPTVTGLTPATGPTAGGTSVVLTGTNFTGATAVNFGAGAATFVVDSPTQITATAPAGAAGTVNVRVTTPGGQSATGAGNQYTYVAPPVNSVLPSISGTAALLQTLSATTGTWSGSPSSYAYQWLRCDAAGANCASIAGATASTYLVVADDLGATLRVRVIASNANGASAPADSAQTAVVAKAAQTTPVVVTAPASVTFGATGTATASGGDSTGAYVFSHGASTGCTVSGTTVTVTDASGTCSLTATRAADATYNASAASAPFTVTLVKADQSAPAVTGPASVTFGSTGTATASGGQGTGAYVFSAGASTGCSVSGTTVTVTDATGTCALTVTRAADDNYNASAASVPFTVTLTKANQAAVTVTAPSSVTTGTPGTAAASGGSGTGAYSFSAGASTGCSVVGTTVTVTDADGMCALTATRAADTNYLASASSAPFTVTLLRQAQTTPVVVTGPASVTFGATGTATVTGGDGSGAYVFSHGASTGCTVSGTTVTVTDASGTCALTATRAGDANYNASPASAGFTVTLVKANQAAPTVTGPVSVTFGSTGTASASGGEGTGEFTFSHGASTGCTVIGDTVTVTNASGTCTLTVTRATDTNYNASAASAPFTVTLAKANQAAVTVTAPSSVTTGTPGTANASGGSGTGAYVFSAGASTGCTVSGTTVTVTDADGTCSLTATRAADTNYLVSASSAAFTVTLLRQAQTTVVVVTGPASVSFGTTGTATATGGDGTGGYLFSHGASTGCTVASTSVTVTDADGTCVLTAVRLGDATYAVSTSSTPFTVDLRRSEQAVVTVTAPVNIPYGGTGTAVASGGSGTGAYVFSHGASTGCTITGTTITVNNGSGTCVLTALRLGDADYEESASSAAFAVRLDKAVQAPPAGGAGDQSVATVTGPGDISVGNPGTATASGGTGTGAFIFDAGASTGCLVSGTTVTVTDPDGTCAITVIRDADQNYLASASSALFTVTLHRAEQPTPVVVTGPVILAVDETGTATGIVTATGGNGTGAYVFSDGGSTGCTVQGATVTVTDVGGTCLLTAVRLGDSNFADSPSSTPLSTLLYQADHGEFSGPPITSGVTLTVWGGGDYTTLEAALQTGDSLWTTVGGRWVVYIVGAPPFVNASFIALYPDGLPDGTPVVISR
ncbi:MAG: hypothetical protein CVU47_08670 [Chloroflexi bacterium HGW-Chloroflexi-9]|nr:MAG: hypothetical protein CVU47_08670 [Chloroflexi bacterium HGW-Chloroflexi-9]